ncbi:MAG TPA: GlsB/YeaQ/YmgE family stress response membrane protein [Candidatus Binatia bacterium]|nr:GlsB/YeaQ/YmgE family stress response membrane protein [Candidatus Binatia bacterium]
MPGFDLIGWIIIGLLAGGISGWFVGTKSVQGCLPTIVVGILGAVVGGWLARSINNEPATGFIGALAFAILGAIVVRLVLRALEGGGRR